MIGLLGGTFDPVHLGHLRAALVALDFCDLSSVHLVLANRPYHRSTDTTASVADRLAMLELACAAHPSLEPNAVEVGGDKPSYTADTLETLRAEGFGPDLAWVIGSDAFAEFDRWHRWQDVLTLAHMIVLERPGFEPQYRPELQRIVAGRQVDRLAPGTVGSILTITSDALLDISASAVRRALETSAPVEQLLPVDVYSYIIGAHLYGGA